MTDTKHPDVTVELIGFDSNVFSIIGAVSKSLKRAGKQDAAAEFVNAATNCGSYDEVLQLVMATVDVA